MTESTTNIDQSAYGKMEQPIISNFVSTHRLYTKAVKLLQQNR